MIVLREVSSLRLGLPWILCAHWNQRRHGDRRRGTAMQGEVVPVAEWIRGAGAVN